MTCLVVIKELGNERLGVHWAEAPGQGLSHRLTLSGNGVFCKVNLQAVKMMSSLYS